MGVMDLWQLNLATEPGNWTWQVNSGDAFCGPSTGPS